MTREQTTVRLVFPHQLFEGHFEAPASTIFILIEDDLFFRQYRFHKQKVLMHRASMRSFEATLNAKKYTTHYLETSTNEPSMERLAALIRQLRTDGLSYYELTDDWLQQRLVELIRQLGIKAERLNSPGFLTTRGQIEEYFDSHPNRMQAFYEWQRRRLNIMVHDGKPDGGKWSFDVANRKKLPKTITLPERYGKPDDPFITDAKKWVEDEFADNPGATDDFRYPITHQDAAARLDEFIADRLRQFGPYEDAISSEHGELFHSLLSAPLNIGLLTPRQVVDAALTYAENHDDVPIESLEGFIRQVIGWREYMRATYLRFGRRMRASNYLEYDRPLAKGWWDGTVGIDPIDTVIRRVLDTAYAHHIERLMILGNSMVLLRIRPDDVYEWFMSLFIDAYDWVMVPNVYAMSQFAAGELITTKPYVSGSNYVIKMSDYKKGEWAETWDALYWQFIHDKRDIIKRNFRSQMVVRLYDNFNDDKKDAIRRTASRWLA